MSAAVSRSALLLLLIASQALAAGEAPLFPWGSGPQQVGGGPALADGREGVPAAWVGEGASLEVLDTVNQRIVHAMDAPVDLSKALGAECHPIDFAPLPDGWLVSDRASGSVARIGRDESLVRSWSGLQRAGRVEATADGTGYVHDEIALKVLKLEPGGKTSVASDGPYATPMPAPGGGVWHARALLGRGVIGIQRPGGAPAVVAVYRPAREGSTVQGIELAGATADGHLVVAMHEGKGDDRHGVRLVRVGPDGAVLAEGRAPPVDDRWLTITRFFRAAGPDIATSFRAGDGGWRLETFPLKAVKPSPPLTVPAGAPAKARAALCGGGAGAGRAALDAALASAFDISSPFEMWVGLLSEGVPAKQLCAVVTAEDLLTEKKAAAAEKAVEPVDHAKLADRRLFVEARALEARGELRPALRAFQKIVLEHPSSSHFGAAQDAVLRIVDSGKLPGAKAP